MLSPFLSMDKNFERKSHQIYFRKLRKICNKEAWGDWEEWLRHRDRNGRFQFKPYCLLDQA